MNPSQLRTPVLRFRRTRIAAAVLCLSAVSAMAPAAYPEKPVRLVVPSVPGGGTAPLVALTLAKSPHPNPLPFRGEGGLKKP